MTWWFTGIGLLMVLAGLASADTAVWTGQVSSEFTDANNWQPAIDLLDGVGDRLTIGAGSPYNPIHSSSLPTRPGSLSTTEQAVFTIAGGDLLPYGDNTFNGQVIIQQGNLNSRGNIYIGNSGVGTLTVNGGSFSYKYTLYLGHGSGGVGTLNVWGGNVWLSGLPVIGSNGGAGRISIKNDRFIYCPGDQRSFFQGLVAAGTMTTDPGWAILIDYNAAANRTSVTATKIVPASEPNPSDWASEIPVTQLKWRPGTQAIASRVFFGDDEAAVGAATISDAKLYLGQTTGISMSVPYSLTEGVTYYWRVDTVTAAGVLAGPVWRFTPADVRAPHYMENLGRGAIAMYQGSGKVYVGWRLLAMDPADIAFNLYRNGARLNGAPITQSTNWLDTGVSTSIANTYTVRPVIDGTESTSGGSYTLAAHPISARYFTIPLSPVPGGDTYSMRYVYAGDLDGDGEYDFVVNRDNDSLATYKTLEAYRRDGTFLWRVNLGPNVQAAYTMVFDFDQDGRAEVLTKTGEMTQFADRSVIGDTDGDGVTDYRVIGRQYEIWDGPEFLSMIDGLTGRELSRTDFIPRGDINDWGDNYGHRANFIKECVAYLDGVRPSIVFKRGPGDYMKMWAWDFVNGQLKVRWTWFNNHHAGLPEDRNWADFHQVRAVDVDGDGKDEIHLGGSAIDDDGTPLYGTELGHGDRFQITDFDPARPGLEVFAIQQNNSNLLGAAYFDAATGQMITKYYGEGPDPWDVGRGDAGDYDPDHKGIEFNSTMNGMYNCKGELIYNEHPFPTVGIWWDADLRREFFASSDGAGNNPVINKWNYVSKNSDRLFTIYSDNGSYSVISPDAARPPFLGDIYGDWREELILEERDHSKFRVYSTTIPTTHRLYTLMQNPYYRVDVTHKGYIVTTYTDYYLGEEMDTPPTPYIRPVNTPAPKTGKILRQWWTGILGTSVDDLTGSADYPNHPAGSDYLPALEVPVNWKDNYGSRIRGYLYPPQSGIYTFWIAADDSAQLRLSADATPEKAALMASVPARTDPHQWDKYTQQRSMGSILIKGRKYYIEVLHKEGTASDHLSVAWQCNGIDRPEVIHGMYLSPWTFRMTGDLTGDNRVDMEDFRGLADRWQVSDCGLELAVDINGDCSADLLDLNLLAENWLYGNP